MKTILMLLSLLFLCSCASRGDQSKQRSSINRLNIEKVLKKGETPQRVVLEEFGSPNTVLTEGNGEEVWSYHRHANQSQNQGMDAFIYDLPGMGFFSGIGLGQSSGENSTQVASLIVYFSADKKVSSFTFSTETY